MPRQTKGPRLYLRRGRIDNRTGRALPDVFYIRDGTTEVSTGCGPGSVPEAERALAAYIAEKWAAPARTADSRSDPAKVLVAEVLALYVTEKARKLKRDGATTAAFVQRLLEWWGDKTLADVRRSTCNAYVAHRIAQPNRNFTKNPDQAPRVSKETARCELECLSAAIGYWDGEDKLTVRPTVELPDKGESQREALTRSQAAALLWAAMGHRRRADGSWERLGRSARANRAHLRRFLLIGLYTGSRPGVTTRLLWQESPLNAWADLDGGMIWRRGKGEADSATKRRPVVRLPRRLLAHLQRWRAADQKAATKDRPLLAVIHHGGEPLAGKIRTGFEGIVRDAGLDPDITPHWLRHTCATWLMERGVSTWDAAAFTGMTAAVLEAHYAHHRPGHQGAARVALGVSGKLSGK
jgi:integrase